MTTYTAIPNTSIDPDSPITTSLMTLMRDNPLAIAEGDSSLPSGVGVAIDYDFGAGSQSAIITDETDTTKMLTPDGAGGVQWANTWFQVGACSKSSSPDTYTCQLSENLDTTGGSVYYVTVAVTADSGASNEHAGFIGMLVRYYDHNGSGQWRGVVLDSWTGDGTDATAGSSLSVPAANQIRLTVANHDGAQAARFTVIKVGA